MMVIPSPPSSTSEPVTAKYGFKRIFTFFDFDEGSQKFFHRQNSIFTLDF